MYFEIFIVGILAGLSPGPDFFVVMKNSLGFGRRVGIATALGIALALIVHISYTVLGFTYIMEKTPSLFITIKLLGAFYLIWLGYQGIRSKPNTEGIQETQKMNEGKTFSKGFVEGFLCNVLNPKAALFFLSIFSQFISSDTKEWIRWIYGAEIIFAVGLTFTVLAIVMSYQKFKAFYQKYTHWFDRCFGGVLIYFATSIVISTFKS